MIKWVVTGKTNTKAATLTKHAPVNDVARDVTDADKVNDDVEHVVDDKPTKTGAFCIFVLLSLFHCHPRRLYNV